MAATSGKRKPYACTISAVLGPTISSTEGFRLPTELAIVHQARIMGHLHRAGEIAGQQNPRRQPAKKTFIPHAYKTSLKVHRENLGPDANKASTKAIRFSRLLRRFRRLAGPSLHAALHWQLDRSIAPSVVNRHWRASRTIHDSVTVKVVCMSQFHKNVGV